MQSDSIIEIYLQPFSKIIYLKSDIYGTYLSTNNIEQYFAN